MTASYIVCTAEVLECPLPISVVRAMKRHSYSPHSITIYASLPEALVVEMQFRFLSFLPHIHAVSALNSRVKSVKRVNDTFG